MQELMAMQTISEGDTIQGVSLEQIDSALQDVFQQVESSAFTDEQRADVKRWVDLLVKLKDLNLSSEVIKSILNGINQCNDPSLVKDLLPVLEERQLSQEQFLLVFSLLDRYATEVDVLVNALGVLDSDLFRFSDEQAETIINFLKHSDADVTYNATCVVMNNLTEQPSIDFLDKVYEAMKIVVRNNHVETVELFLEQLDSLQELSYFDPVLADLIEDSFDLKSRIGELYFKLISKI